VTDVVVLAVVVSCALAIIAILFGLYAFLARKGLPLAFAGMVIVVTLGTEYALRPFQILSSGEFGWEPSIVRPLAEVNPDAVALASIMSVIGVALFALFLIRPWVSVHNRLASQTELLTPTGTTGSAMSVPLGLATAVAVVASSAVALQLGRVGGSLEGEFGRQNIGSGYTYLLVNLAGLSALVALAALPRRTLLRQRTRLVIAVSYAAFVGIHFLVLGGRAEIIIVTVALLVVVTARLARPRKPVLVVILLLAIVALGLHRVTTREFFGDPGGKSKLSLALASLQDPLALVTRYDVSAYDKLVLLEEVQPPLLFGETYLAALLSPLPGQDRAMIEGGNRQFTKVFIPDRYQRGVTYEGVSMLGEARFNFGWLGPPFAAGLAGFAYGALVRRAHRGRQWLLTLALATGVFPSLVRADALNTAALGGSLIVFTLLISAIVTRRQRQHSHAVTQRAPGRAYSN
jgi:hypothetical protein